MKRIYLKGERVLVLLAATVFISFLAAGAGMSAEGDVPEGKKQEWAEVKASLQKELAVCKEHCAGNKECLDNCEKANKARLEREFQRIAHSGNPSAKDDDIAKHPSCPYCGMDRAKFAHSRVLVDYEGSPAFGACSLHCAAVDMAVNIDKTPKAIMVGDYNSKKLIDAEKAVWVIGGKKMGVMTKRAKWAFEDKAAADAFVRENGGEIASFDQAMKASYEDMYEDTKMIRDRRKAKRMMKSGS